MTADPLCRGVNNDISAVIDGADEVSTCTEGVIYYHWHTSLVRDSDNLLKVWYVVFGVADGLDVDGLGLLIDCGLEVLGLITVDELGLNAQSREKDLELIVCASIEVRGRNNVISGVCEGGDCDELGSLARGSC